MTSGDICRICYCNSEESGLPLISPCLCTGSIKFIDPVCLQKWMGSSSKKSCELCKQIITMENNWKPFRQWTKPNFTCVDCKDLIMESIISLLCIFGVVMMIYWRMTSSDCGLEELIMWTLGIYVVSLSISLIVSWTLYLIWAKIIILFEIVVNGLVWSIMRWRLAKLDCSMDITLSMVSWALLLLGSRSMYLMWTEIAILIEKWKVNNRMVVVRTVDHV